MVMAARPGVLRQASLQIRFSQGIMARRVGSPQITADVLSSVHPQKQACWQMWHSPKSRLPIMDKGQRISQKKEEERKKYQPG